MYRNSKTGRTALLLAASALSTLLGAGAGFATTPITYDVSQTIGGGSVTGTITTDGTIGPLGMGDFSSWNLNLNGVGASLNLTDLNSAVYESGSDVNATATQITFDFSGSDNGYLLFQQGPHNGDTYWCNATSGGICFQGATVAPISIFDPSAQNVPASGTEVIATAATGAIPEPSTWVLMLVGFGSLGLGAYRQTAKARLAPRVR